MMTETVVNVQEAPNNNAANKGPQSASPLGWIKINIDYFKTIPGILKIVEFILGILCLSLAHAYGYGGTKFFLSIASFAFIATIFWIIIYFLSVREALPQVNWILSELINTAIWTLFYGIASLVQLIVWAGEYGSGKNITAGVFGLINTGVYGFATFLLSVEWQRVRVNN